MSGASTLNRLTGTSCPDRSTACSTTGNGVLLVCLTVMTDSVWTAWRCAQLLCDVDGTSRQRVSLLFDHCVDCCKVQCIIEPCRSHVIQILSPLKGVVCPCVVYGCACAIKGSLCNKGVRIVISLYTPNHC